MMRYTIIIALAAVGLLTSCGKPPPGVETPPAAAQTPDVFVATPPEGEPVPVPEARKRLSPGDELLLQGRVMGVKSPFVDDRAVFVLGDEGTLTPCNAMPGHGCPMPWDTCCDPLALRRSGTATIQVLGADGRVLARGLKGVEGLAELSRVVVAGKVAPTSTEEAFVVSATAIHVAEP